MGIIIYVWGSQPHKKHPVRLCLPRSALFRWRYVPPRAPPGAKSADFSSFPYYPGIFFNSLLLNMAVFLVDLPIENGDCD